MKTRRPARNRAPSGLYIFGAFQTCPFRGARLRRAGVPESVVMKISGHKTREVFARYNIVDSKDTTEAMRKLNEFYRIEDAKLEKFGTRTMLPS